MSKKLLQAAAGAGGEALYVEDVFSTYLYEGNGSTQTITNGIDLDGEGGLVWLKRRSASESHYLYDTERGTRKALSSDTTSAQTTLSLGLDTFNSDGFRLNVSHTDSGVDFTTWTFRKAPKFFDVVTYTGDGVDGRMIDHNLESVPACIIIKSTSTATGWVVSHSSLAYDKALFLHDTAAEDTSTSYPDKTLHTSTQFNTGSNAWTNYSGRQYVAYLFASDAGGFGDDDESIIKCGSYTGNGSTTGPEIDLGFEPQWLIVKRSSGVGGWRIIDVMRGWTDSGPFVLEANLSNAEGQIAPSFNLNSTGFNLISSSLSYNGSGETYIYIAIRRPMKTPESGTEVFGITPEDGTDRPTYKVPFVADMAIRRDTDAVSSNIVVSRLQGDNQMDTDNTSAESAYVITGWDYMDGWGDFGSSLDASRLAYMFKRATGFFDVVCYTGTGSNTTQAHNLGVAPEMMIVKRRNLVRVWAVWASGIDIDDYLTLNGSAGVATFSLWQSTLPTATQITLGTDASVNGSADTYVAYLFATLAGVSKVGSYTGTGSNVDVDCGFSAGARFILIKRTDSTGDWYVWDSVRGIVAGNDPYLLLNSTAAEVTSTDYIDPLSSGFTVTSSAPAALNASGGTYIFLAIA